MKSKKHIYIVGYCGGDYEDYFEHIVFATEDEESAKIWVKRYDTLLSKLKEFNDSRLLSNKEIGYITIRELNSAFYHKIELR